MKAVTLVVLMITPGAGLPVVLVVPLVVVPLPPVLGRCGSAACGGCDCPRVRRVRRVRLMLAGVVGAEAAG